MQKATVAIGNFLTGMAYEHVASQLRFLKLDQNTYDVLFPPFLETQPNADHEYEMKHSAEAGMQSMSE